METRVDYHCDRCQRVRCLIFIHMPDVPDIRKVVLPADWSWIEEGLYCEECAKAVKAGADK